jgi:hypothetical protein
MLARLDFFTTKPPVIRSVAATVVLDLKIFQVSHQSNTRVFGYSIGEFKGWVPSSGPAVCIRTWILMIAHKEYLREMRHAQALI